MTDPAPPGRPTDGQVGTPIELGILLSHLPDIVFRLDRQFRHLFIGGAVDRISELHPERFIGRTGRELGFPPDLCDTFEAVCREVLDSGQPRTFEAVIQNVCVLHRLIPEPNAEGEITSILGVAQDITERKLAEHDVLETRERLRQFVRHQPASVAMLDRNMCYLEASDRWLSEYGLLDKAPIHGRSHYELFPDLPEHFKEAHRRGMQGEIVRFDADLWVRPDHPDTWLRWEVRPWRTATGDVGGIFIFAQDITASVRTQQNLRETQLQLEADLQAATQIASLGQRFATGTDLQTLLTEILDTTIAITGADFGNIQLLDPNTQHLRIAAQRGFPPWWIRFWNHVAKTQGSCGEAIQSGHRVIVEDVENSPIFAGKPELEAQRRAGVRAVYSTPLVGRSGEPLGMLSGHYRTPFRPGPHMLAWVDLLARQAAHTIERTRADESVRTSNRQMELLQARTEAALRDNQHKFGLLSANMPEMFQVVEPILNARGRVIDYRYLEVNAVTETLMGRERRDIEGKTARHVWRIVEQHWFDMIGEAIRTGKPVRVESYSKHLDRHYDARAWRLDDTRVALLISDITSRVRAIDALRASEERVREQAARLAAILDTAVDSIITIDGRGIIQSVNPATVRAFGYSTSEMIGKNVSMLMPPPYKQEHDGYLANYHKTGQRRIIGIGREAHARRKDGSEFPIDLAISEVIHGKLYTGMVRDTSERTAAAQQLRATERLSSIGTLAAGLGHDMNNILLPLRAYMTVASKEPSRTKAERSLRHASKIVDSLQQMADGLHYIAADGGEDDSKGSTNLRDWWTQVGPLLSKSVPRYVKVKASFPKSLPPVAIAAHRLSQAVLNLVVNAGQAILPPVTAPGTTTDTTPHAQSTTTLAARRRRQPAGIVHVTATAAQPRRSSGRGPAASMVRLIVRDNGTGMPEEVKRRALDLFYTTKPRGIGTGLGLPLAARVVSGAGGSLDIESTVGKGTSVVLNLPVVIADRRTKPRGSRAGPIHMTAAFSLADRRVASLMRNLLHKAGVATPAGVSPKAVQLWIIDPRLVSTSDAADWIKENIRKRRPKTLVVLGPMSHREMHAWADIATVIIDHRDDYYCIRDGIIRSLQHMNGVQEVAP